jgi:hypothetical protein
MKVHLLVSACLTVGFAVTAFAQRYPCVVAVADTTSNIERVAAAKSTNPARAKNKTNDDRALRQPPVMEVKLVRSTATDCEPNCQEWIAAQGRIAEGTVAQFRSMLAKIGTKKLPILIHSPGGSVDHAMAIGKLIRSKGLSVAVTRTEFTSCGASDTSCKQDLARGLVRGTPKPIGSYCASACPLILAGGVHRFVGAGGYVGVHQIASTRIRVLVQRTYRIQTKTSFGEPVAAKTLVRERRLSEFKESIDTPASMYEKLGKHLASLGVDSDIVVLFKGTPHTSIRWLTRDELTATHMATDLVDGARMLAGELTPRPQDLDKTPVEAELARIGETCSKNPTLAFCPTSGLPGINGGGK